MKFYSCYHTTHQQHALVQTLIIVEWKNKQGRQGSRHLESRTPSLACARCRAQLVNYAEMQLWYLWTNLFVRVTLFQRWVSQLIGGQVQMFTRWQVISI